MEENKIIAEMLSTQEKYCKNIPFHSCLNNCQVCRNKALVEANYVKLKDGEIVLSKEEAYAYEQYKKGLALLESEQKNTM